MMRRRKTGGAKAAIGLAGMVLAGTAWASAQVPTSATKERCVTLLAAQPAPVAGADAAAQKKNRCTTVVRHVVPSAVVPTSRRA